MVPLVLTLRDLLELEPALWTFVTEDGVEPTYNHGERVQRLAVICANVALAVTANRVVVLPNDC